MEGIGKFLFLSGRLSRTKGLALLRGLEPLFWLSMPVYR